MKRHSMSETLPSQHGTAVPVANDQEPARPLWLRAKDLAARWSCSVSQAHRICARNQVRRCVLGGTGRKGKGAVNAMLLYHRQDILDLEQRSTL